MSEYIEYRICHLCELSVYYMYDLPEHTITMYESVLGSRKRDS